MIFTYAFFGFISGFLSSTPLGPINFWVTNHKLSKSPAVQLFFFLTAVILVDLTFAALALRGQFDLLEESTSMRWAGIISGFFTLILGIFLLRKASSSVVANSTFNKSSSLSSFLQGFILTAVNPAFILFWLFIANQIISNMDQTLSWFELFAFLIGVLCGDIVWFSFLNWILSHLEQKSQEKTLKNIRVIVGIIFIFLGSLGVGTYVFK